MNIASRCRWEKLCGTRMDPLRNDRRNAKTVAAANAWNATRRSGLFPSEFQRGTKAQETSAGSRAFVARTKVSVGRPPASPDGSALLFKRHSHQDREELKNRLCIGHQVLSNHVGATSQASRRGGRKQTEQTLSHLLRSEGGIVNNSSHLSDQSA